MRMLCEEQWRDGFLDYARGEGDYRIAVRVWHLLLKLRNARIVRSRGRSDELRLVLGYLRHFGVRATFDVIRSRGRKGIHDQSYVAFGMGTVIEGPEGGLPPGQAVAFLAPRHPECVERVVLPSALVRSIDPTLLTSFPPHELICVPLSAPTPEVERPLMRIAAWSPHSGTPALQAAGLIRDLSGNFALRDRTERELHLSLADSRPVRTERTAPGEASASRPAAVLVGYGQHARTVVLPGVRRYLKVVRVHDIDARISARASLCAWSTEGTFRAAALDERVRAALIAGYHHTHAELAAEALDRGMYAVVEKPVATTAAQLDHVLSRLRNGESRLFVAFQRRYMRFNDMALEDLAVGAGDPVSYHAIVYEHPLPEHHWYRWPNSRSRILSNGCHWIDHFLHLNDNAEVARWEIHRSSAGACNCSIELVNGAYFTLMLADSGSGRRGVHDFVELRARRRTVSLMDGCHYVAEDDRRVLRRASANRLEAYARMYRSIAERIRRGDGGDSLRSLEVGARLVVELDRRFRALESAPRTRVEVPRHIAHTLPETSSRAAHVSGMAVP